MLRRSAVALSRRMQVAASPVSTCATTTGSIRMFSNSIADYQSTTDQKSISRLDKSEGVIHKGEKPKTRMIPFDEVKTSEDLLPPGAEPGTIPTDLEQATGLERFEILGKMQGIDVFDMKPLDASRKGTLDDPIMVKSPGDEQYVGCTGYPADSHVVLWLTLSRARPLERCSECGGVYQMKYIGPPDDPHDHDHDHDHDHHHAGTFEEPKTWADFVLPEYRATPAGFKHPERI